jgi:hypothetical protein
LVYLLLRWYLILEASGICSAAWVLAWIHKRIIAGYQADAVYIGTPEERAAKDRDDHDDEELHVEAGQQHPRKVPTIFPVGTTHHNLPQQQTNITEVQSGCSDEC